MLPHYKRIPHQLLKEIKQNQLTINQSKMKTIKKINHVVALVMIAATLMFTASCKKENLNEPASLSAASNQNMSNKSATSPWQRSQAEYLHRTGALLKCPSRVKPPATVSFMMIRRHFPTMR